MDDSTSPTQPSANAFVIPAFRHDPTKSVLVLQKKSSAFVAWRKEPMVCGYRQLTFESKNLAQDIPVPVCSTPAVVVGIGVIVGSYDGRIRFYNQRLEKVYWERHLDSSLYASFVVDPNRQTVVIATINGLVACFDLRGSLVWSTNTEFPIYATPAVLPQSNVLIVAAFNSHCIGLDLETGQKLFDRLLPKPWHSAYGGSAAHRDPYASPVGTQSGNVIVCCAEHVLCFAPDGTEIWRQEIGHAIRSSPVAFHAVGHVAVCPVDGRCLFLDSSTGQECGEVFLDGKITASPAVSGHIVAVGTRNGTSFGLDIHTHEIVWKSPLGAPRDHTSFSVLPDGNFIATFVDGNIISLGCSDGRFLWETSQILGLPNHDPAMDITPVAGPDGSMYCGSYSGMLYHFQFQPVRESNMPVSGDEITNGISHVSQRAQ